MACKLDYDDQANEWLKEVTPKVQSLFVIMSDSKTQNVVYKSNTTIVVCVSDAKLLRPYSLKAKFCVNIGTIPPQLLHFMIVM